MWRNQYISMKYKKTQNKILAVLMTTALIVSGLNVPVYAAGEQESLPAAERVLIEDSTGTVSNSGNPYDGITGEEIEIPDEKDTAIEIPTTELPAEELLPEETPAQNVTTDNLPDAELPAEGEIEDESITEEDSKTAEEETAKTTVTLKENGIAEVLAQRYTFPSNLKEVTVAVWSAKGGQDDLKWYTLKNTDQDWKATVNLYDHASEDGVFYFHLYYKTADNKMTFLIDQTLTTTDVFHQELTAVEKADGFELILRNPNIQPQKVSFAIWSQTGGQDDLKWYNCTYNTTTRTASCQWDLSNLKHYGAVVVHCYVTDKNGKQTFAGDLNLNIPKPAIGSIQAEYNKETGAYTITLSAIEAESCISKILVPVWSDSKQQDIIWHQARKNADGTYTVASNVFAHGNRKGTYNVHVYVTDKLGVQEFNGSTTFSVDSIEISTRTEEIVSENGICEIRAINYPQLNTGKDVRVAFWSAKDGQDDLKWYPMTRKEELSGDKKDTVWYAKPDFRNHGAVNGIYYAHVYYNDSTGKAVCASTYSFEVKDLFKTNLTAEQKSGAVQITLSNPTVTPKSVRFAIWSQTGGQDDIKWYDASYNSTTKQAVLNWKGDNLKHSGNVIIHAYVVQSNGQSVYQGQTTVDISGITAEKLDVVFTQKTGSFKIDLSGVTGFAKSMKAAVWNDPKQADIKWYTLTSSASGNWTYTGKISDHGYRTGTYNVHVYATDTSGKQTLCKTAVFTADTAGELSITPVSDNYMYKCTVTGLNTADVKGVKVAVWSSLNGQDDIIWYTAVKSGSSYTVNVPVKNHKTLGTYIAHAYVTRNDGSQYNSKAMQKTFAVDSAASCGFSYIDRQADNGTFVVRSEVYAYTEPTTVQFKICTAKDGEDDLETVNASLQSDGLWAYVVNPCKHNFETGDYLISATAVFADGTTSDLGNGTFHVSDTAQFYTVVASEQEAYAIVQGYTDAGSVTMNVWSLNGGKDDLRSYTAEKTETGWRTVIRKADHGNAGQYQADLYVDGTFKATDLFSFDENRYADSWSSISSAHGAGGQGSNHAEIYTNCLTAMNNSYAQGYRTYEIDVLLTSDSEPVLFHTWSTNILDHYKYSSATAAGPTYSAFMKDTMYGGKYATTDYKQLLTYLTQHPDIKVLLDTKYRTSSELRMLYTKLQQKAVEIGAVSAMRNQIIPYFFATDQLEAIKSVASFNEYHYATYGVYKQSIGTFPVETFRSLLQFCKMNQVLSISMWDSLATGELIRMADSYGINVYVHTTDDPATAARLLKLGAAGIITNSITPVQALGFLP